MHVFSHGSRVFECFRASPPWPPWTFHHPSASSCPPSCRASGHRAPSDSRWPGQQTNRGSVEKPLLGPPDAAGACKVLGCRISATNDPHAIVAWDMGKTWDIPNNSTANGRPTWIEPTSTPSRVLPNGIAIGRAISQRHIFTRTPGDGSWKLQLDKKTSIHNRLLKNRNLPKKHKPPLSVVDQPCWAST